LTVGQKETITYRSKRIRISRPNDPFTAPTHGIGYGLGETGIVLNRLLSGERSTPHRVVREATGTVVEEAPEYVTVVVAGGKKIRVRVSDIIRPISFFTDIGLVRSWFEASILAFYLSVGIYSSSAMRNSLGLPALRENDP